MFIIKILKNKIFHFLSSRILTYGIQFVNTLYIAIALGSFYLGIWGFISLMITYSQFLNLGIPQALNVNISKNKSNQQIINKYFSQSIILSIIWSLVIGVFIIGVSFLNFSYFQKYNINQYYIYILIIIVLVHFNSLYVHVYRVSGKLFKVAFFQTSVQISFLITLLLAYFFKINPQNILLYLLYAYIFSEFFSFFFFLYKSPLKADVSFKFLSKKSETQKFLIQGLNLLLYNVSFYLMIVGTKTIVSYYYLVEEFGYLAFSWSLAQSTIMVLQIISFIIYPKMINRFSVMPNDRVFSIIIKVKKLYVTASFLFVYFSFSLLYFLSKIFSKYEPVFPLFIVLSIALALYNFSFGSSAFCISRNKEKMISKYSFISLIICLIISYVFSVIKLPYVYMGIPILVAYCIMTILINNGTYKYLKINRSLLFSLKEFFSLKMWIPMIAIFVLMILKISYIYFFIPLLLFIILNLDSIRDSIKLGKKMIDNPDIINIE